MSILDSPYFSLNRRALKFYGQWPHQSKLQNRCHRIVSFLAISSILIPKLIKIYVSRHDIDEFILCMPMVVLHIEAMLNLSSWCFNDDNMYKLMDKIQNDWESLKTDKEREILNEHWKRGRSGLTIYASAIAGVLILFLTSPGVPKVFDIIAPLNESRPRVFPYETEYFIDQDDYYLYILMHSYMTVPVSIGLIVLFNTVMGSWIHHAAGMLAIVAYQLETIHNIPVSDERFSRYEKNQSIQKRLAHYIKLHNDAIEFIETVESSSSTVLFIVVIGSTLVVTVTGTAAVIKMNHINESSRYMSFSIGTLGHLYYMSYVGNQVIKASESINQACYASEWYTLPIKCQKILIPIMVRTTHPCTMTAGKLYVLSMDNFSELVKKAMSLFTFINSTTH